MQASSSPETKGKKVPYKTVLFILSCVLVLSFFLAIVSGRYGLSIGEVVRVFLSRIFPITPTWENMVETVVFRIRLPRVLAAMLIGASLATAGATYQGLFRNPLVSPDFLGVTSGASVGAAFAIVMGYPTLMIQAFAFTGGITATLLTTTIPKLLRNPSNTMLVLSGVVVSGFLRSIMSIMRYVADPQTALASIVYWQMGSLASISTSDVTIVSLPMLISLTVVIGISWWINIMSLGEVQSTLLGVNFKLYRSIGIVCATILAVCSVSIAGEIGWVGLAIPHLSRLLVGVDNKKLIPVCILTGAIFILVVDTLARNLIAAEIPISILTGIIGAPFFISLLYKQKNRLQ